MTRKQHEVRKWVEGIVDVEDEHIKIYFASNPTTIARIGNPSGIITVQFLNKLHCTSTENEEVLSEIRRELDFYFIELNEDNPWKYAIYHCSTAANIYSNVHWSYFPKGYKETLPQWMSNLKEQVGRCLDCTTDSKRHIYNIVAEDSARSPKGINYWSDWGVPSPNYSAKLMIVGQDWGSVEYLKEFIKLNGGTLPSPYSEENNITWKNLMRFLKQADIVMEDTYLTNALLCLREHEMSGNSSIRDEWFGNCFKFLKEQIGCIQPKVIAALGQKVFNVLLDKYNIKPEHKNYGELVKNYKAEEYKTKDGIYLYPLYHTGGLGQRNRKISKLQGEPVDDFKKLKKLLTHA